MPVGLWQRQRFDTNVRLNDTRIRNSTTIVIALDRRYNKSGIDCLLRLKFEPFCYHNDQKLPNCSFRMQVLFSFHTGVMNFRNDKKFSAIFSEISPR